MQMSVQGCFSLAFTSLCMITAFFIKAEGETFLALLVYVDDILVTGSKDSDIQSLKADLHDRFAIKDFWLAKYFLGLEMARSIQGIYLSQRKYILDILLDTGLSGCKPAPTPLPQGVNLSNELGDSLPNPEPYQRLVGRLLYLNFTRPDITLAVQQLSQFVNSPRSTHWDAAVHMLRYLKGCPSLGLFYPSQNSLTLQAYADADWGTCLDTRKSVTGYCIFLGDALISWK